MPPSYSPSDPEPQNNPVPPPSGTTLPRNPELAGRAGNWEEYQRPRAFHRPGLFLGLALMRLLAWSASISCAIALVQAFLAKTPADRKTFYTYALVGLVSYVLVRLIGYIQERSLRCSLCHGTPLHDKSCRMHRKATKLPVIGHSGATILSTVCTGKFRCSYCGTPFRLKR